MIGWLSGTVETIGDDWLILDVGGVGYEVYCSARTLDRLPGRGEPATLHIETRIREEMIRLYGFTSAEERSWFRALQGVQGVGAKVALAVLTVLAPGELATAIALADTTAIAQAHGVGKRVAERIAAELKNTAVGSPGIAATAAALADGDLAGSGARADAISALVNLGYGRGEAAGAVAAALRDAGDAAAAEQLIRLGLRELAR